MKATALSLLVTLALLFGAVTPALAEESVNDDDNSVEQTQELEQDIEVHCTTGAYGQESVCDVEASQRGKQSQKIVLRDGQVLGKHVMVDTALDTKTIALLAGLMVLGAGSFYAYKKI